MRKSNDFEGRHFPKEVILQCVRWYLSYRLSSRNLSEMMINNIVDQDHRFIKWRVKPVLGFGSFHTANRALKGIEIINIIIIRKGQIQSVDKGDIIAQLNFIDQLFTIAS